MWVTDFVIRLLGREISGKLNLQEGTLDTKPWFQSKTIWTAVVAGLLGLYGAISSVHPLPLIPSWIYTLLSAVGLYGLRTADTKIG